MSKLQSIIESAVRGWFPNESILINHRPDWLHGMEMDIYLPNLNLAIEVQGHQHRFFCPKLHENTEEFRSQKWRDHRKRKLISARHIKLIAVHPRTKRVLDGLPSKLTRLFRKRFLASGLTKQEWRQHLALIREYPRFKIRRDGLLPVNAVSSQFLKRSMTPDKPTRNGGTCFAPGRHRAWSIPNGIVKTPQTVDNPSVALPQAGSSQGRYGCWTTATGSEQNKS